MKGTGRIALLLIISLLAGALGGCGTKAETTAGESYYAAAEGMESTPIIEYTVPKVTANVLIDRLGYQTSGKKEAIVKGKELPEKFELVDAGTEEVVYEGIVEKATYNAENEVYMGYAVFEEYKEPGTYYLECDKLGRSYTFSIGREHYAQLFGELVQQILQSCDEQTASVSEVTALLTAYEWYPELFGDEDANEIPDILERLVSWFASWQNEEADGRESVPKSALLAKFSYLYQKYDKKYATTCLQTASALFDKTKSTITKDADSFFALTELYRASGLATYRKQILEYKTFFENSSSFGGEREYLYGAMTYMVTRQNVDVDLCNILLDTMMDRGEEISNRYEDMTHPVAAKNNGTEEILAHATEVIFVNYVLNSYQYHIILEEFLHYLGGRNLQSVMFYSEEDDCTGYILLLAQLAMMPDEDVE